MKKIYIILIIVVVGVVFLLSNLLLNKNTMPDLPVSTTEKQEVISKPENIQNEKSFQPPLDRASERVTKKPFGVFITPQNSPVQPENFSGYHTGTDFEIFPEEMNVDIYVHAVCSGKLAMKKMATGYGGVIVESCKLDGEPITVVYGHLKLSSIAKNIGDDLQAGDTLGILGAGYSTETSGERKHLHLGFHKGAEINPALSSKSTNSSNSTTTFGNFGTSILGYVQSQSELSGWIDPCFFVCK